MDTHPRLLTPHAHGSCQACGCTPTRRDFLKFTGISAAAMFTPPVFAGPFTRDANAGTGLDTHHPVPLDKKLSAAWLAELTARGQPSRWSDWAALQHLGMPVAGIGTGTVYLGGDGRLWGWDIFNMPHEGAVPNRANGVKERDGSNYVQPSKMESPWNVQHGLILHLNGQAKRLDHTGFAQVEFTGQYPIGHVQLRDPAEAISAVIEAYSPFIPLDYDNSSLPVTVLEVTLHNAGDAAAQVELEAYVENAAIRYQPSTRDDNLRRRARVMPLVGGAMVMGEVVGSDSAPPAAASLRDWGTMALAIIGRRTQAQASRGKSDPDAESPLAQAQEMAVRAPLTIPAKGAVTTTVLIAWHFPHVHPDMQRLPDPRRWVAERFADAAAVATYSAQQLPRLAGLTHSFRDTWYGGDQPDNRGTLPHWLLERALWPVSALTTNGTYRLTRGRVWGWEGTGCCAGTCTHVWHYGQAAGRLFPQLEIDLRERTDFTPEAMTADGCIGFRGSYDRHPCIDGQAGILLRCYREHLTDGTGYFLKRNWPHIHQATEFLVRAEAEGKPNGNDGIFTRRFENTLDAKWGGQIPWLVGMYLAGLSAAAAMADEVGDQPAATRWRHILAMGATAYAGYFDPQRGYFVAQYTAPELLPVHVGPGSHIDMCLGDFWLAQVGLPAIGNKEQLRQAMMSLYQYNFVPDMGVFREQTQPYQGRPYALAGEAGLVMATWPHGGLPDACKKAWQFKYFQECMSGFEHAAAALMVSLAKDEADPLLTQGLTICRAVHDRYDAARRNPYNEVECSDHYARAMASYGVFVAACGFHCHAPSGLVRFEPKLGAKDFAAPFVGAGAWGRFAQQHTPHGLAAQLTVRYGSLRLARLELTPPAGLARLTSSVKLAGKKVPHHAEIHDGRLAVALTERVTLAAGQSLEVVVGAG